MKRYWSLLIPMTVALVIVGCGIFGGEDYYPLKVGNQWKYEGYMARVISDTVQDTLYTMTFEHTIARKFRDTIRNIDVYMRANVNTIHYLPPYYTDSTVTTVDSTQIYQLGDTLFFDNTPALVYPLEVNKTWHDSTYKVLAKEDLTVPAGTYRNCWKIQYVPAGGDDTTYYWYKDGVGLIKVDSKMNIFGYPFRLMWHLIQTNL
ncbi:MAG: hypothetical protein ABIK10_02800 [candidate division WOR-3 bacterium]